MSKQTTGFKQPSLKNIILAVAIFIPVGILFGVSTSSVGAGIIFGISMAAAFSFVFRDLDSLSNKKDTPEEVGKRAKRD